MNANQSTALATEILPTQNTLLLIDVQDGLFRKSTPIYRAEELLTHITTLVERAHAAGSLVVYVQHSSDKVLPFGLAGWRLHPRLHPGAADLIIHKQHGNAFEDTVLHQELSARGISRVVVAGLVTHGYVKATCLGARELGYTVVLAADGHSSYSKDAARVIEEWNHKLSEAGVEVRPTQEVVFA